MLEPPAWADCTYKSTPAASIFLRLSRRRCLIRWTVSFFWAAIQTRHSGVKKPLPSRSRHRKNSLVSGRVSPQLVHVRSLMSVNDNSLRYLSAGCYRI